MGWSTGCMMRKTGSPPCLLILKMGLLSALLLSHADMLTRLFAVPMFSAM